MKNARSVTTSNGRVVQKCLIIWLQTAHHFKMQSSSCAALVLCCRYGPHDLLHALAQCSKYDTPELAYQPMTHHIIS